MLKIVKVTPTCDNRFQLLEAITCYGVTVPKGYITNGANIPRILWSIIPPFKPKYLLAVIVHDYLCDMEKYKLADELFERLLYKVEKTVVTTSMVLAVKAYHWVRY